MNLRKILWVGNLALLVLLGYVVAGIFIGPERTERTVIPTPVEKQAGTKLALSSISPKNTAIILERNIFGSAGTSATETVQDKKELAATQEIAKTQLNLKLLGTVAGDVEVSRAVIEDMMTKVQDLYKTGDIVQGARIERIERNKVILLHGDRKEVLELYLASGEPLPGETEGATPVAKKPGIAEAVTVISPTQREINKKAFLAKIGGIEAILKTTEVSPYIVDGETKGLRITGLENVSMAKFVGLENGDVIQVVNGQELTSLQKAFQVFRKARGQSFVDVQLLRDKKEKTLSFGIK